MDLPGLSFAPGEAFQLSIAQSFNLPVSCPNPFFALVVAFGRCKFRLDPCSVSLMLQATFGGAAHHFHVSLLLNQTFKFFVSCKQVGFKIANLRTFSCDLFSFNVHLWGMVAPIGNVNLQSSALRNSTPGSLLISVQIAQPVGRTFMPSLDRAPPLLMLSNLERNTSPSPLLPNCSLVPMQFLFMHQMPMPFP